MKINSAFPSRLSVPQWRPHFVLALLLTVIISACGGGGGGGATPPAAPPPPPASASDSGAIYVFTGNAAAAFAQQAYIKASNTGADDLFGIGVALSGDTLAVGAPFEDSAATGIDGAQSDNSASDAGVPVRHLPCRGQMHTSIMAVDMVISSAAARAEMANWLRQGFRASVAA